MNNVRAIVKTPLAVQLNRIAVAFYAALFGWALWHFRHISTVNGTATFLVLLFISVLGIFYSFVRAGRARLVLAVIEILIPGICFTGMCFLEMSQPEGWAEWLRIGFIAIPCWFGIPIILAVSLFKRFHHIAFEKHGSLVIEIRPAGNCDEYFNVTKGEK